MIETIVYIILGLMVILGAFIFITVAVMTGVSLGIEDFFKREITVTWAKENREEIKYKINRENHS